MGFSAWQHYPVKLCVGKRVSVRCGCWLLTKKVIVPPSRWGYIRVSDLWLFFYLYSACLQKTEICRLPFAHHRADKDCGSQNYGTKIVEKIADNTMFTKIIGKNCVQFWVFCQIPPTMCPPCMNFCTTCRHAATPRISAVPLGCDTRGNVRLNAVLNGRWVQNTVVSLGLARVSDRLVEEVCAVARDERDDALSCAIVSMVHLCRFAHMCNVCPGFFLRKLAPQLGWCGQSQQV